LPLFHWRECHFVAIKYITVVNRVKCDAILPLFPLETELKTNKLSINSSPQPIAFHFIPLIIDLQISFVFRQFTNKCPSQFQWIKGHSSVDECHRSLHFYIIPFLLEPFPEVVSMTPPENTCWPNWSTADKKAVRYLNSPKTGQQLIASFDCKSFRPFLQPNERIRHCCPRTNMQQQQPA